MTDTFPFWPPTSPQRPGLIPGRTVALQLADLIVNQTPRGRNDEIPLKSAPLPRIRHPEYPAMHTPQGYFGGGGLYQYFMQTETIPREQLVAALT